MHDERLDVVVLTEVTYYGGKLLNRTKLVLFHTMWPHSTWCISIATGLTRNRNVDAHRMIETVPHVSIQYVGSVEWVQTFHSR